MGAGPAEAAEPEPEPEPEPVPAAASRGAGARGRRPSLAQLRSPSIVLGVGLGGFFDGIVLHQVLQWHHMLSNTEADRLGLATYPVSTVEGLRVNILWDGFFHVMTYVFVVVGLLWLWRRAARIHPERMPSSLLIGGLLAGWGLFNLVEGIVDHHLLAIHHVYDTGDGLTLLYDLLFLLAGALFLVVGWRLMRRATSSSRPT